MVYFCVMSCATDTVTVAEAGCPSFSDTPVGGSISNVCVSPFSAVVALIAPSLMDETASTADGSPIISTDFGEMVVEIAAAASSGETVTSSGTRLDFLDRKRHGDARDIAGNIGSVHLFSVVIDQLVRIIVRQRLFHSARVQINHRCRHLIDNGCPVRKSLLFPPTAADHQRYSFWMPTY